MANQALAVRDTTDVARLTDERMQLIKRTIASDLNDREFELFIATCRSYGLDPVKREIFATKDKAGRVSHITSRDGYLSIALRHPEYRGMRSGVVRKNDTFEVDAREGAETPLVHKFGADRGPIVGAWALVYREGRMPSFQYVEFSEYKRNTPVWDQYPSAMIEKVAHSRALKFAFGISGLVTQEEMGYEAPRQAQAPRPTSVTVEAVAKQAPARVPAPSAEAEWELEADGSYAGDEEANPLTDYFREMQEARLKADANRIYKAMVDAANAGDISLTESEHKAVFEAYDKRLGELRK